jgi:hypothetical protein
MINDTQWSSAGFRTVILWAGFWGIFEWGQVEKIMGKARDGNGNENDGGWKLEMKDFVFFYFILFFTAYSHLTFNFKSQIPNSNIPIQYFSNINSKNYPGFV